MNGTSTPKDLTSRIKILELFTLHVLPRNDEWEYARSFITNSDILDEERREAFLQTLQELQDVQEQEHETDADGYEDAEEDLQEERTHELQRKQASDVKQDAEDAVNGDHSLVSKGSSHKRTSSEVDYGIEQTHPNGTHTSQSARPQATSVPVQPQPHPLTSLDPQPEPSSPIPARSQHISPPSRASRRPAPRKPAARNTLFSQARNLVLMISNLTRNLAGAMTKNPTALLRMLLFLIAFLMVMSRREARERVKRIMGKSWDRVRGTVGMGVKVSYI